VLMTTTAIRIPKAWPSVVPWAQLATTLVHQPHISAVQQVMPPERPLQRPLQALPAVKDLVRQMLHISARVHTAEDVVTWASPVPRAHAYQQPLHLQPSCQSSRAVVQLDSLVAPPLLVEDAATMVQYVRIQGPGYTAQLAQMRHQLLEREQIIHWPVGLQK